MILVTGADGFIGSRLVRRLGASHQVIAVDRQFTNAFNPNIQTVACDITQFQQLEAIFQRNPIRLVVHLASLLNSKSNSDPSAATQVNILGSLNLLNLSRTYNISKFIYGSSISIYGPLASSPQLPANETAVVNPVNLYGETKRYVESLGAAYKSLYQLNFASLRIATVVGSGVKNSSSPWRSQIFDPEGENVIEIPFTPDEKLPLVHVQDVARQLEILVHSPLLHGVYNTPSETLTASGIASIVRTRFPDKRFTFGTKCAEDIPSYIDGKLFCNDFAYTSPTEGHTLLRSAD